MKVIIKGKPKEIADLALELQNRLCSNQNVKALINTEPRNPLQAVGSTVLRDIADISRKRSGTRP